MPKFCRAFLLAATFLAAFSLTAQTPSQSAPLRVAIVGLEHGHVSGFLHALQAYNNVQLVGVEDPDSELLAKYQKQYSWPTSMLFKSEDELIEKTHPQAVLVYTSVGGHRAAIEIAAKHNTSVMVEKPLTISLADARAIRATAQAHHIHVLVNFETTWYASNRAAYEDSEHGALGPLRRVVVHDGHEGPAEIHVQPEFLKWLTDPETNGAGALYDFGCYGADLVTWLMHGERPLTVTAVANHDKPSVYPRVDDDATIIIQYPHTQAVLQASWNWPFARKDMEVYGATGYDITIDATRMRNRHHGESAERAVTAPVLPEAESSSLNYLAAVLNGKITPKGDLTSLDTNMIVMQILDAARESVRTGKTIHLTEAP